MTASRRRPPARRRSKPKRPLQVVGTINAYCALLAERAGFRALYLSGAGVANASFGLPDLGITTLNDVCEDVRRITARDRPAAARGRRHRLGRGLQHRAHRARPDPRPARRACTSRTRCRPSAAAIARARRSSPARRWSTASRPRSMARTDPRVRHHGAHRRARGRGPAGRDRARASVRRGRRGHDLRRGADDARGVPRSSRARCACRCSRTSPSSARRRCSPPRSSARPGVRLVLYPLSAFRAMSKAALEVLRRDPPRRHAEERARLHADARGAVRSARLSRIRAQARRAVRRRKSDGDSAMNDQDDRAVPSPRNPSRSPACRRATPRSAPWGAPATTCTTAATTSSRSPRAASSRRSRTC